MRQKTALSTSAKNGPRKPFATSVWILTSIACARLTSATNAELTYPIVDTNQGLTYDNIQGMSPPAEEEAFYGRDAQYTGNLPSYTDNGDGTITDNVTGLTWARDTPLQPTNRRPQPPSV